MQTNVAAPCAEKAVRKDDLLFDVGESLPQPKAADKENEEEARPEPPDMTIPFPFPALAGATFSNDGVYRYSLWRRLRPHGEGPVVMWVGLNPSTADAETDDPTVRAMLAFSKKLHASLMLVGNVFAFRATNPKDMFKAADPVGPENSARLIRMRAMADICVAAWGNGGSHGRAGRHASKYLWPMMCLAVNKTGHPKHPLYVARKTELVPFDYGKDAI